ncbi:MAG: hypothetical protein WBJ81_02495 [Rickettsiales bacterium]
MQIINRINQILKIAVLLNLISSFTCWATDNSERAAGAEVENVDMISSYEEDDIDIDWTDLPKNIQQRLMKNFDYGLNEEPKQIKFKQLKIIIHPELKTNFNKINLEKVRDHFSTTKEGKKLSRTLDKHIKAKAAAERKAKLNKQQAELNKSMDDLKIRVKEITEEAQNTIEQSRVQKTVPQQQTDKFNSNGEVGSPDPKEQKLAEGVARANKEFTSKPEEPKTYNPYDEKEMAAAESKARAQKEFTSKPEEPKTHNPSNKEIAAAETVAKVKQEPELKERKRQEKIEAEKKSAAESNTRAQKEFASKPEELNTHNPSNKEMAAAEEGFRSKRKAEKQKAEKQKAEKQKAKAKQDTSSEEQRASANQTEKITNSVSVTTGEAKFNNQQKSNIPSANSSSSYVRHKGDIKSTIDRIKITNFDIVNNALSE